ncbi:MAG: hypothetical protein GY943_17755, partial [Chloroflexi bacterium]|nr:hypothetical protein [Chloroflexota bacterium]
MSQNKQSHQSNWKNDSIDDLAVLLTQARPAVQKPSSAFKTDLRRQLLSQYEQPYLSKTSVWHLWRFAGTAVALSLLVGSVVWFAMVLSQQNINSSAAPVPPPPTIVRETAVSAVAIPTNTQVAANEKPPITPPPPPGFPFVIDGNSLASATLPIELSEDVQITKIELSNRTYGPGDSVDLTLQWTVKKPLDENFIVFVHVKKSLNSDLVSQVDMPFLDVTTLSDESQHEMSFSLSLPNSLESGIYYLATGLYDSKTGMQLPDNDRGGFTYLLNFEVLSDMATPTPINFDELVAPTSSSNMPTPTPLDLSGLMGSPSLTLRETAVPQQTTVTGTGGNGLTLRDAPKGSSIGVLDEGSVVYLEGETAV